MGTLPSPKALEQIFAPIVGPTPVPLGNRIGISYPLQETGVAPVPSDVGNKQALMEASGNVFAPATPIRQAITRKDYAGAAGAITGALLPLLAGAKEGLPEMRDNYLKDLSNYAPRMYHETGAERALEFTGYVRTEPGELFWSNTPDLALGQGPNKGVLIEIDPKGIQGRVNTSKPMWEAGYKQGAAEFKSFWGTHQRDLVDATKSITVKPDMTGPRVYIRSLRNSLDALERRGWTKTTNADGSVTWRKP